MPEDSYATGYSIGRANAERFGREVIGTHYIPTAEERAQCVNFHSDDKRRAGWLAGWTDGIAQFRDFQERELRITSAAEFAEFLER